jgi:hypothetical protein
MIRNPSSWFAHGALLLLPVAAYGDAPARVAAADTAPVLAQAAPVVSLDEVRNDFLARLQQLEADGEQFPASSTTGDRMRREFARSAFAFADRLELAIRSDEIPADSHPAAWDDALTVRQRGAVVLLEVGACDEAAIELRALVQRPETLERPRVAEAAQTRLDEAEQCIVARDAAPDDALVVGPAEPVRERDPARGFRAGAIASGGVAAGAVAAGVVFGLTAQRREDDAREQLSGEQRSLSEYDAARRDARASAALANVSLVTAGVAGGTAAVLGVVAAIRGNRDAETAVEPAQESTVQVLPGLRGVSVRLRW